VTHPCASCWACSCHKARCPPRRCRRRRADWPPCSRVSWTRTYARCPGLESGRNRNGHRPVQCSVQPRASARCWCSLPRRTVAQCRWIDFVEVVAGVGQAFPVEDLRSRVRQLVRADGQPTSARRTMAGARTHRVAKVGELGQHILRAFPEHVLLRGVAPLQPAHARAAAHLKVFQQQRVVEAVVGVRRRRRRVHRPHLVCEATSPRSRCASETRLAERVRCQHPYPAWGAG